MQKYGKVQYLKPSKAYTSMFMNANVATCPQLFQIQKLKNCKDEGAMGARLIIMKGFSIDIFKNIYKKLSSCTRKNCCYSALPFSPS